MDRIARRERKGFEKGENLRQRRLEKQLNNVRYTTGKVERTV